MTYLLKLAEEVASAEKELLEPFIDPGREYEFHIRPSLDGFPVRELYDVGAQGVVVRIHTEIKDGKVIVTAIPSSN